MSLTGFRITCPISDCTDMTVPAPSGGSTAGALVAQGDLIGVYLDSKDEGEDVVLVTKAPGIVVPCASDTYTLGEKVYYDSSGGEVTATATGNTLCGTVAKAETAAVTEVTIELDGSLGIVA